MDDTLIKMLKYSSKGFSCSQIIILLGLELREESNPSLVKSMAGLSYGCGVGESACGVLSGACCLIALYTGKGTILEDNSEKLPIMLQELNEWFESTTGQKYGGITCNAIVGEEGPEVSRNICAEILRETFTFTLDLLGRHGIDVYDS
jgi:hypothetical protein